MIDELIAFADRNAVEDVLFAISNCDGGAETAFSPESRDATVIIIAHYSSTRLPEA
jgi:hypothetical protein